MLSICPVEVSFPMTPVKHVQAATLQLLRRIGAMDTARIVLRMDPDKIKPHVAAGSPMLLSWGDMIQSETMVGYVHSYRETTDRYEKKLEMLLIGASYPMVDKPRRSFSHVPIHHVAQMIANDYRFNYVVDYHPLIREQILQADLSDWDFLQRLASEWGYVCLFDGITLRFHHLEKYIKSRYPYAVDTRLTSDMSPAMSTLKNFRPSFSAMGRTPIAISQGFGIDPVSGKVIQWREPGTGVAADSSTNRPVLNLYESEFVAAVRGVQDRFPFIAEARVLFPYHVGVLDAYRIKDSGQTMTWSVLSIMHTVSSDGEYEGKLVLGSNGGDEAKDIDRFSVVPESFRPRSEPVILAARSYYEGTGANVLVDDQRWKAHVMHTRVEKES